MANWRGANDFSDLWARMAGTARWAGAPPTAAAEPPSAPPPTPLAEANPPAPMCSRGALIQIGSVAGHVIILGDADRRTLTDLLQTPRRATA